MAKKKSSKRSKKKSGGKSANGGRGGIGCGSPFYGLGVIGAAVYFWQVSPTLQDKAIGMLKALVWPAFAVYKLMEMLSL